MLYTNELACGYTSADNTFCYLLGLISRWKQNSALELNHHAVKGYSGPFRKREGKPRAEKSLYHIARLVWARISNAIGISLLPGGLLLLLWLFWFVWFTTKCFLNLPDLSDNHRLCFTPAGGDLVLLCFVFIFPSSYLLKIPWTS